jgi:hypothetical protein
MIPRGTFGCSGRTDILEVTRENTDVLCFVHCERILLLMSVMGQGGLIIIELSSDQ